MNAIRPIHRTEDTVTLRRSDFDALIEALDEVEDTAALIAAGSREVKVGKQAARADHLAVEVVLRLVAGEHPVRIWREHRAVSSQALAETAGISRSYIAEIEGHKKPGSIAAYRRMATALGVTVDDLVPARPR